MHKFPIVLMLFIYKIYNSCNTFNTLWLTYCFLIYLNVGIYQYEDE